jgi:HEAT repeat protein
VAAEPRRDAAIEMRDDALRSALDDPSPTVRRLAVRAIASAPGAATGRGAAARLIAAFDRELDSEVRLEAVSALGRLGTFDALQRLLRLVGAREAHQGAAVRVAALHAIAQARGDAAHATLRALIDDREPTVRQAARRLLAAIAA